MFGQYYHRRKFWIHFHGAIYMVSVKLVTNRWCVSVCVAYALMIVMVIDIHYSWWIGQRATTISIRQFILTNANYKQMWMFLCWILLIWRFGHFVSCDRYQQRDGEKATSDGSQQSVPLCSTSEVQLRFLNPDDLDEVRTLCQDWFPIDYPMMWYRDITSSTRFYALAAVYNLTIIGLIVAEIKPYCRLNKEVRPTTIFINWQFSHKMWFCCVRIETFCRSRWAAMVMLDTSYRWACIKNIDGMVLVHYCWTRW